MKKVNLIIAIFLAATFSSCYKHLDEIIQPSETSSFQSNSTATSITWDQLPGEFKNAVRMQDSQKDEGTISARSGSIIVDTYGPYGSLTGSGFSINPPSDGSVITGIGIGNGDGDGSYISTLIVWYKNASGTLFTTQAGKGNSFIFLQFQPDEYIKGIAGRSSSFLNSLTITTNKTSITVGGTGGAPFAATTLIGDWILGFWGRTDNTRITQINFDVYSKPWQILAGSSGRDIAVALDGTAYLTNSEGKIYKMPASATTWTQLPGSDGVRIAANAGRVCMVNTTGLVYELLGSSWRQLPGHDTRDITINSDSKLWAVHTNGSIWRYNDISDLWELMPGNNAFRIAAGSNMIWMIGTAGNIFKWNGSSWVLMNGTGARDIAVGNDGSVWLTRTTGQIYNYNASKSSWNELSGSDGENIAANNNKAQLVNSAAKIYKLGY